MNLSRRRIRQIKYRHPRWLEGCYYLGCFAPLAFAILALLIIVAATVLWLWRGRDVVTFTDRFKTIETASHSVDTITYNGRNSAASSKVLDLLWNQVVLYPAETRSDCASGYPSCRRVRPVPGRASSRRLRQHEPSGSRFLN